MVLRPACQPGCSVTSPDSDGASAILFPSSGSEVLIISLGGIRFASWPELMAITGILLLSVLLLLCLAYIWGLLLFAIPERRRVAALHPGRAGAGSAPHPQGSAHGSYRFTILIPAHNEELVLDAALESLAALEYPADRHSVLVIADNCTDATAQIARCHGATVLERSDDANIGKGYALQWALDQLLQTRESWPSDEMKGLADFDAIVVLDADTLVSPNLLACFSNGLSSGKRVMQVRYEVLNASETWRTRLMSCALAIAHVVKPLGRERLGLSDGLKGNGMCFAREVVERVPWSGASITEDIEYTLRLCREGYRVSFLPDAAIWAQMPTTGAQAASQRKRWEGGRYQILFGVAPRLLGEGISRRSMILCDRAMELIIPPFAELFAIPAIMAGACGAAAVLGWRPSYFLAEVWASLLVVQAAYIGVALWVARVPKGIALSMLFAPFYILWKFGLYATMLLARSAGGWKRTERHKL